MRKHPSSSRHARRPAPPVGAPILALEKRIAFDGAAAVTATKMMSHAVDALREATADHDLASPSHAIGSKQPELIPSGLGASLRSTSGASAASEPARSVVFIESDVPDVKDLIKNISASAQIVMLDANRDGVDAIASYLKAHPGFENVYVFSHGSDAHLDLGTAVLDSDTMLGRYASDLATIKGALGANANILVYGCDFAQYADGNSAAHLLASLTGANVAASTNLTGGTAQGGDFVLEDQIGHVSAPNILAAGIAAEYEGVLAAPTTIFANTGTGAYKSNLEFLTYANTSLVANGITNGATATYATAEGGTVTITFGVSSANATNAATYKPAALDGYGPSKFYGGYNNTSSTTDELYGSYNGTAEFTITFSATDKNGNAYMPNIAFADGEVTENQEYFTVTTNGGAFQNVELEGNTGYSLTGAGTQSITLKSDANGVPLLTSTGVTTLDILNGISGGAEGFAIALIVPTLSLDKDASSKASANNYQTTFTEKGSAVAIADTDTNAVEPGVTNASSATIVLTNAQTGDALSVGTLPSGITSSIDTSKAGQVTVTLSGSASLANYDAAIEAVKFSNSSSNPSTIDRNIAVTFNDGSQTSNTAVSTVHVTAVNDAPVETTPGPQTTNKDTALSISGLSVSDVDANGASETVALSVSDGTISLASTSGLTFSSGTGTNDTTAIFSGTLTAIDNAIATVKYQPKTGYYGADTLTFVTNDNGNTGTGGAMSATKTVGITVNNVNPADNGSIANQKDADGQTNISITTAQSFSDSLGLALTYSASGLPKGLAIDPNTGKITGTIDHDASTNAPTKTGAGATLDGTYTVIETANDGQGGTNTQTFTIDATNQAPVVGTKTANQTNNDGDTIIAVDASKAFSDPNGDPLTYTASNLPSGLSINSAGMITGTVSKTAAPGTYSVVVTGTDDKGAATTETFNWVINDILPTAVADTFSAPHDTASTINVFGNDSDALGRQLTITQVNGTAIASGGASVAVTGGAVALNSNGTLTYTPAAGYAGTPSFTYTIADPVGGTTTAPVNGTITDARPIVDLNGPQAIVNTITNGNALGSSGWSETNGSQKNGGYYFDTDYGTGVLSQAGVTGLSHGAGAFGAAQLSFGFAWNNGYPDVSAATVNVTVGGVVYAQIVTGSPGQDSNVATVTYLNGAAGNVSSVLPTQYLNWSPVQLTLDLPANVANSGAVAFNVDASKSTDDVYFSNVSTTTLPGPPYGNTTNYTEKSAPVAIAASNASVFDGDSATIVSASVVLTNKLAGDQLSIGGIMVANGSTGAINGLAYTVTDSSGSETIALSGSASTATYQKTLATIAYWNTNYAPSTVQRIVNVMTNDGIASSNTAVATITIADLNPTASGTLQNEVFADGSKGISISTAGGFADPSGSPITFSATGLPTGLSINPTTGVIGGAIDHDASAQAPTKTGASATLDGTYAVAIKATDSVGRTVTQGFAIDAINQAPVVGTMTAGQTNFDGDTIVAVDASKSFSDPNGDPLTYAASNLPAGLSINGAGLVTGTIAKNALPGTYAVIVTATDDKGAATSETFSWIVKDVPPTAVGALSNQSFDDGQPGIALATAGAFMPSNGNPLTYTATGLPKGLAIDPTTGKITGTIDHDASKNAPVTSGSGATLDGTYNVTVIASDGLGGTATQTFTVNSSNQAPVTGTATPNQTSNDGQSITPIDTAGVFSDPNAGDVLTFSASNLPTGLVIDAATGRISGTIAGNAAPGVDTVRVVATDDKGATTREIFTWTVNDLPPTVAAPLANQAFADGQAPVSITTATGFNSPNGLPLLYTATGLPPGLSIDGATGQITGALDHDASKNAPVSQGTGAMLDGTYAVTITVSDGQGGMASQGFKIDALNSAPKLVAKTADQYGIDGNRASVDAAAAFTDKNTGDTLTYAATGLPPGLSIDQASGLITGTLASNASTAGPYSVTVTVTDDKGAASSETFAWNVENVAPVATPPLADRGAYDGASVSYTSANGFTNPNGLPLTYSATGLPRGLSIDPTTGVISGTIDHDASAVSGGVYAIAVSVDDGQGGTATNTFHLAATNQAPTLVATTANQATLDGHAIAPLNVASAFIDPNGDPLTFTASNLPAGLAIDPTGLITGTVLPNAKPGTYAVIVTAVDDKGAATSETFTWTVADIGPAVAAPLAPQNFPDATGAIAIATASGFASPIGLPLTYHVTGLPDGLTIDTTTGLITGQIDHDSSANAPVQTGSGATLDGTYTVVVTVDDGQGKTATQSFTIDATNNAPVLSAQTPPQAGAERGTVSVDAAAAFSDPNIGDTVSYTVSGLPAGLSINQTTGLISGTIADNASQGGPYTVAVTATDDKGAATTETFQWTVDAVATGATPPLGDRSAYDGTSITLATAAGFDNPTNQVFTYSATGLPAGLAIDSATGIISGTLDHNASIMATGGVYTIAVTAKDGQGGTAVDTFDLTATNQAPEIVTTIANQVSSDGEITSPLDTAPAFADPNGDTLTYSAGNLPAGLVINAVTGRISGTVSDNATPGADLVTVTATDSKGVANSETLVWTINNLAPAKIGTIAPQSFPDSTGGIAIATAGSFANPRSLAYVYNATGLPSGLSIDSTTGVISGQLDHDASAQAPTVTGSGASLDGTYSVVVSATSSQGGIATQAFTIDARNTAPSIVAQTSNIVGFDGQPASLDVGSAFRDVNVGDTLTFAANGLPLGLAINSATGLVTGTIDKAASLKGPYTVLVTATDNKGAATTETFTWTIDNIVPIATPPLPNLAAYDGSTLALATSGGFTNPNALPFTYSAAGLPAGLSIDPTTGLVSGAMSRDASVQIANGVYTVSITANDGQGGTATNTFQLTATNQAPVVGTSTPNQSALNGQTITPFDISTSFSDPNHDPLTFTAYNLPSGLTINPVSGQIAGTIVGKAAPGDYQVTIVATDDKGAANAETFQYIVGDSPPIATGVILNQIYADSTGNVAIPTAAHFAAAAGQTLTFVASGLPKGLSLDPGTGLISGYISHDASKNAPVTTGFGATLEGIYTVTITASDGQGGTASRAFMIETTNQAPVVGTRTPDQANIDGDGVVIGAANAFVDPNLGDVLTFAATGLPKGLAIDPTTGLISGTIDKAASASGPYAVVVTATDDKGAATSEIFVWTVADLAPTTTGAPDTVVASDGTLVTPIDTASHVSNPNGLPLTYSATGLPLGLTIDPATGLITGVIDHDASANAPTTSGSGAGVYTIVVTADDGQGGMTIQGFTIEAHNDAPVVVAQTGNQAGYTSQSIPPLNTAAAFSDPNGDPLTFAATGLPKGLAIDPTTGLISGTIDKAASASGPYAVVVTATDDKGAATSETFVWSVADLAPTTTGAPDMVVASDGTLVTPIDTASHVSNPNGLPLTYSATGLPLGLTIDPATGLITGVIDHDASANAPTTSGSGAGVYAIVVTADDGQGGKTIQGFTIEAHNDAPVIAAQTGDQAGYASQSIPPLNTAAAFSDPNGDPLTFAATGLPKGLAIDPTTGLIGGTIDKAASASGPYAIVVTATDDKGAATSETFVWSVADLAPTTTGAPDTVVASDGTLVTPIDTASHVSNPNGLALTYSATGLPIGLTIDPATGLITGVIDHDASANAPTTSGSGAGVYTIVVTADDGQGGMAIQGFTIETHNDAPVVAAQTGDQAGYTSQSIPPLNTSAAFSDPNGDPLTYAATGLPKGLAIDPTTGLISGTIDKAASASGPYAVVVTATDDKGAATSETFVWTVADLTPTTTGAPDTVVASDGTLVTPIDTASHVSNPNGLPLTYSATGLPLGLTIDPTTGLITGVIDHDASANAPTTSGSSAGLYTIVVTADDGQEGMAIQGFTIETHNDAPVVAAQTGDQAGYTSQSIPPLNTAAVFSDPNGDPLTFAATGLPKGLAIDPTTGLISGTIDKAASASGPYAVVVTATDDKGAATSETFVWSVADLAPTTTGAPGTVEARDGMAIAPIDTASHVANPDGLPLTYGAAGLPAGLAIDPTTGLITGLIDHDASVNAPLISISGAGLYTVVVTADDGQGGTATQSFIIEARNDAPAIAARTADQTGRAGQSVEPLDTASAFRDPNGDPLIYTATGLPPGLTIDAATGRISGVIDTGAGQSSDTVTVTATDDKGAATRESFVWNIQAVPPNILSQPSAAPRVAAVSPFLLDATPAPAPIAALHAGGAVLEAVNQISGGEEQSVAIHADDIVVSTVNNLRPLNGLQDLGGPGGIVRAGAATNETGDRALRASTGGLPLDVSAQTSPDEYLGSSLRESSLFAGDPGITINVETLIHDRVITIILDNTSQTACVVPVARYEVTGTDGSALPEWLRPSAKGMLSGKIPTGVETMNLKIKATLANGIVSERHIKIGTIGGTVRPAGRSEGRLLSDMVAAQSAPAAQNIARYLPR